jgi:hypothetical protein
MRVPEQKFYVPANKKTIAGMARSYKRIAHLFAEMARSYKIVCVFQDNHFALRPCAAATNSSLSIIASASGSAQPSSRQMSRPSLQAPKRFTRSASS